MSEEVQIMQVESIDVIQAREKASLDIQVVTAKQYPRDITKAKNNSIAIVTMDNKTAESCSYSLPRGGKTISGPSVHLARIIAQNWGNLRVEAKVVEITSTQVVSQAICFDLETNYAVKIEVRKKITNKFGQRFNDDLITLTGNVANAISYRNAVFNVVPKAISEIVYKESKNMITGDISDEAKLIKKRNKVLNHFRDTFAVTEEEILKVLGIGSINGIKQDQIVVLVGLHQAIKDGDTTVEDAFNRESEPKKTVSEKKEEMKKKPNEGQMDMP